MAYIDIRELACRAQGTHHEMKLSEVLIRNGGDEWQTYTLLGPFQCHVNSHSTFRWVAPELKEFTHCLRCRPLTFENVPPTTVIELIYSNGYGRTCVVYSPLRRVKYFTEEVSHVRSHCSS